MCGPRLTCGSQRTIVGVSSVSHHVVFRDVRLSGRKPLHTETSCQPHPICFSATFSPVVEEL